MAMRVRRGSTPPVEDRPDEPIVHRAGPHWVSQDITLALAALVLGTVLWSWLIDPGFIRFVIIPAVPLVLRLAVDIPRYWHFEVVLTTRRLVVNVGIVRDVFHELPVSEIAHVSTRRNALGRLMGFGDVDVVVESPGPAGEAVRGTYTMRYVRRPEELAEAVRGASEALRSDAPG